MIAGGVVSSPGQSSEPTASRIITSQTSQAPRLPKYLVYRHFLAWIDSLDKQASLTGTADPYKFAEPFAKPAALSDDEVDLLRGEAKAMVADLRNQDGKASAAVTAFRAKAKAAIASGQPLPPIPAAIRDLQRQRTALLVQHFVQVQSALKPATRVALDSYLDHEFVPHLSMKKVAVPASRAPNSSPLFSTSTAPE